MPAGPGVLLIRLALVLSVQVVALGAVYVASVRTVTGRQLADASLRGAITARPLFSGTVQTILDVVSVASLLGAMATVAVIALLRLARLEGLVALGILVASNVSTWLLKDVLLSRPDLQLREIAPATLNSLPSGHTTAVFSAVAALCFVVPRRWRAATASVGAGYAGLTGLATMLAGWHRAADAVAAFLVVGAWATVAAAVLVLFGRGAVPADAPQAPAQQMAGGRLAQVTLGLLGLGVALSIGVAAASLEPDDALGSATAFVAGGLFITGTALAVMAGVLEVLRVTDRATGGGQAPGR